MKTQYKELQRTEIRDVISRYLNNRKLRKWIVTPLNNNRYRITNEKRNICVVYDYKVKKW